MSDAGTYTEAEGQPENPGAKLDSLIAALKETQEVLVVQEQRHTELRREAAEMMARLEQELNSL
jgi:hypothetical protein